MKNQFIWRLKIFGLELLGIYMNVAGDDPLHTNVVFGLRLIDGLNLAICRDDQRYYFNSLVTLAWRQQ